VPDVRNISTIIVRLYDKWNGTGLEYFASITKDALQIFQTGLKQTKREAVSECLERLK
jgi:hypothetical protein